MNKSTIKEYFGACRHQLGAMGEQESFLPRLRYPSNWRHDPAWVEVLELGSGTGDLLAFLKPSHGVGLNVGQGLTDLAQQKHPDLEFHTIDVDSATPPGTFDPQYIVMTNMLD